MSHSSEHTCEKSSNNQTCTQKTCLILHCFHFETCILSEPNRGQNTKVDPTRFSMSSAIKANTKFHELNVTECYCVSISRSNWQESHFLPESGCEVSRSGSPTGAVPPCSSQTSAPQRCKSLTEWSLVCRRTSLCRFFLSF